MSWRVTLAWLTLSVRLKLIRC